MGPLAEAVALRSRADFANFWFGGVALLKESRDFRLGKMLPAFRVAQIFPALLWVKYCLLSAQQSHCTVASNVFHCHLFQNTADPIPAINVKAITIIRKN